VEERSVEEMAARLYELTAGASAEYVDAHRAANDDTTHAAWLARQLARAEAGAAA
jgi:hypothetical protein